MQSADTYNGGSSSDPLLNELLASLSESLLMEIIAYLGLDNPISVELQKRIHVIRGIDFETDFSKPLAIARRERKHGVGFFNQIIKFADRAQMTDPQIYNGANIGRSLWYRIRDNKNVKTSKENVLKIALVLRLNYWELYYLVSLAGYSFMPHNNMTDYIIALCAWHKEFNPETIDRLLVENGKKALFSEL